MLPHYPQHHLKIHRETTLTHHHPTAPLGFGTDIGGSIRIPSAFNGLYGLRPSSGRLPYQGMANSMDGQNTILSVVGPLSRSARGLGLVFESLLATSPWLYDPLVIEKPFSRSSFDAARTQPLCFALMQTDGVVNPVTPIRRAVRNVASALEARGHKVIPWTPPSHAAALDLTMQVWTLDAGADVRAAFALSGEPAAPQLKLLLSQEGEQKTAEEIAALNVKVREFRKRYLDYWTGTRDLTGTGRPVDAVICPLAPTPSVAREGFKYVGYSVFGNLLDLTSVVVPGGNVDAAGVDAEDKTEEAEYVPLSDLDKEVHDSCEYSIFFPRHTSYQIPSLFSIGHWRGKLEKQSGVDGRRARPNRTKETKN